MTLFDLPDVQLDPNRKPSLYDCIDARDRMALSLINDENATYALMRACARQYPEAALAALATGKCDVNAKVNVWGQQVSVLQLVCDCYPETPKSVALALIESGAIIIGPEIISACASQKFEVVRALVNAGADVDYKNDKGYTARDIIAKRLTDWPNIYFPAAELLAILDSASHK